MSKTFLIADPHFGHVGVTKFLNFDGSKLRPWNNVEDMDRDLISRWNSVVSKEDKVYLLGDVVINRKALPVVSHLNGKKVLIKGNHDIFRIEEYLEYFYDVRACHVLDRFLLSHIPIHPNSLERWKANIHGHLHSGSLNDPKYYCVSVEQINYTPIDFEVIRRFYAN